MRTGDEYLQSLNDGRAVVHGGRAIDVLKQPGFRNAAQAIAQFYDFQNRPEMKEIMTFNAEDGTVSGMAFKEARSKEDLKARAASYAAWAEVTCGFMGRSPDYMNTCMACLAAAGPWLKAIDSNAGDKSRALYEKTRREDLCLTHTFVDPFKIAGSSPSSEMGGGLRVTRETSEGIYLSGTRGIATLAPFSNLNFNAGLPPVITPDGTPASISFIHPINAKDVRWICRESYDREFSHDEAPLSNRADEIDCVALFENAFIPRELIFAYIRKDDIPKAERLMRRAGMALRHHGLVRSIAKARFMFGLAHLIAESSKVSAFVNVRARLGEIATMVRTLETFGIAIVEGADYDAETGIYHPHADTAMIASIWSGQYHQRIVEIVTELGGSRFMSSPQEATMEVLGDQFEKYFSGNGESGRDNIALHRLAWDATGSGFGSRQALYERFYFGDRTLSLMNAYTGMDKQQAVGMVRRLLTKPAEGRARFPLT